MARIRDQSVREVVAAANIVDVVSLRTSLRKAAGTRYMGRCPFHEERSASFSVNSDLNLYHCFGCGKGGDVVTFVRETEGLDFVGAIEWLAERFRDFVAEKVTVLPTMTGISRMFCTSSSKIRPFSLVEMWRALVTVACTTKTSTPASAASGANFFVFIGVEETAATPPAALICGCARRSRFGWMGAEYTFCISAVTSLFGRLGDLAQYRVGVFVAGLHALKVEDGETAGLRELGGHAHIDDAVHRGGDEGQCEVEVAEFEGEFYEGGVDRVVAAGDDGDVIKAVGAPHFFELGL